MTANPEGEAYFRTTHFHKMMFLLYQGLRKKHLDLKLPYCWYHYGPYMEAIEFERQVGVPLTYYSPVEGPTTAITDILRENVSPRDAALIETEVRKIVNKYKKNDRYKFDYLNDLLDDAYAYAPFKFQVAFNRDFIKALGKFRTYDISREEVELYLDRLVKMYPRNEMDESYDAFLEWDDTIRLALNYGNSLDVSDLAAKYWSIFTEELKIKRNENISEDIKRSWSDMFSHKYWGYLEDLETKRNNLLRIRMKGCRSNDEVKKIVADMNNLAYQLSAKR
jgi:hypothetical protein